MNLFIKRNEKIPIVVSLMFIMYIVFVLFGNENTYMTLNLHNGTLLQGGIIISISIWLVSIFVLSNKAKLDIISLFLIGRILISIPTILTYGNSFGQILKGITTLVLAFLGYFICSNYKPLIYKIKDIICVYSLIISIQVILTYLLNFIKFGSILKSTLEISIGESNYIAANLIVCLFYLLYRHKKNKKEYLAIIASGIALIMTMSFGVIVSFIVVNLIYLLMVDRDKLFKFIVYGFIFIIISSIIITLIRNKPNIYLTPFVEYLDNKILAIQNGDIRALTSGRNLLYEYSWQKFLKNPLLGQFKFDAGDSIYSTFRSHNLILESLIQFGIIGSIFFFIPLMHILSKNIKSIYRAKNKEIKIVFLAILAGLIHGMVEPNFFALEFEFLWWSLAGISVAKIRLDNKIRREV